VKLEGTMEETAYPNPEDMFHSKELGHCFAVHLQSQLRCGVLWSESDGLGEHSTGNAPEGALMAGGRMTFVPVADYVSS